MEINKLIALIVEMENSQQEARTKITQLKNELAMEESDLIEFTIKREKLLDQLQTYRLTSINYQLDLNDENVQVFLSKYPKMATREEE